MTSKKIADFPSAARSLTTFFLRDAKFSLAEFRVTLHYQYMDNAMQMMVSKMLTSCPATLRARAERAADVLRNGGTHAQMRRALCTVKAFSKEVR